MKNKFELVSRSVSTGLAMVLLMILICTGRTSAQTDTGAIAGTVTDPTGAVIAGAAVTATSTENGLKLSATSSGSGSFIILAVPRGSYRVMASATGFASSAAVVTINVATTQS
ncbi:MAG: carboxypeptidase-like regulatory domain-containing protein, partial [Terracidiphilus sp.]|nr:carboxypeptidase-like regulatory domain-containing protein [Terracidiphilus sp.]